MQLKREPLSKHSSLRVGVEADIFTPQNTTELQQFLQQNNKKVIFLGLGSNTLFAHSTHSIIIKTQKLRQLSFANGVVSAQVGVPLKKLTDFAQKHHISGANWLGTIPGTVGGALKMNAGCFGKEFWQFVQSVSIIDTKGNISYKTADEFDINYRSVAGLTDSEFFLSCELAITGEDIAPEILHKRYDSQPIGSANCGSVFKNPPGQYAAALIESCNLKGKCIGNACISTQHANFIINNGGASAEEVLQLIAHIQQVVFAQHQIQLEPEVIIY